MKIVFAVHTYCPEKNGVQAVTMYTAEKLAQNHEVYVIAGKNMREDLVDEEVINGVKVLRITAHPRRRSYRFEGDKNKYIKLIRDLKPEIFICVCTQSWQFDWLINSIKNIECKKVLYTHDFSGLYPYGGERAKGIFSFLRVIRHKLHWKRYYKKYCGLIKQFDLITHLSAVSESMRYVEENEIKNNCIIGNAVEDIFFEHPVCNEEKRYNAVRPLRYICVANFSPIKNQEELIKAFCKANIGESELVLVGGVETAYYRRLVEICNKYNETNKKITFEIGLSRQEISELLSDSDVYISSSLWEGYSVAILEAAAKGLAIITTNVGNARTIPGIIVVNETRELPYMLEDVYYNADIRRKTGQLLHCYANEYARIDSRVAIFEEQLRSLFE